MCLILVPIRWSFNAKLCNVITYYVVKNYSVTFCITVNRRKLFYNVGQKVSTQRKEDFNVKFYVH